MNAQPCNLSNAGTVSGDDELCVISAADFLAKWPDTLVPARDDAIVLHYSGGVLFYCHEEELEYGKRKASSSAAPVYSRLNTRVQE